MYYMYMYILDRFTVRQQELHTAGDYNIMIPLNPHDFYR